jgi:uncharacterized membrane protein YeaQ/YmgE (transglycosylase-associated protein family)
MLGDLAFSQPAQQWVNVVLIWIGFGTLAGLLAKAVLPGRDPQGTIGTMVVGIAGSTIGLLVFYRLCLGAPANNTFNPISPIGMLAAAAGAFAVLIGYRVMVACVMFDHPPEAKEAKEGAKE